MADAIFELAGTDSTIFVFDDRIELEKKRGWNWTRGTFVAGGKGTYTIPMKTIRTVEIREMAGFVSGMLLIDTGGNNTVVLFGGVHNKKDYCDKCNETLRQIKAFIESKTLNTADSVTDSADELKKLKELLDMGIVTQEEFDAKKKQLLGL